MPHEIAFQNTPVGYSTSSARGGEMVRTVCQEFTSSEDGSLFISRLEGLPREIISKIPGANYTLESTVDHLLVIIRPDKTATVYLNDLDYSLLVRAKGAVSKGADVTLDQILDVTRLKLNRLVIPPEAGLLVILSAGWRKGLFFDLTPLTPGGQPRSFDVEATLGHYYAYLNFQHLFSMVDATWEAFMQNGWFPFIHLRHSTIRQMIAFAQAGFAIDEQLDEIAKDATETIRSRLDGWKTHPTLAPHHEFIAAAYRQYVEGDYLSATAILFPRIEGVLRTHHFSAPAAPAATQGNLIASSIDRADLPPHRNSLLLPERFRRYLREVYFAGFDPRNPQGLSRHTVSHGVALKEHFNRKGAVVGFLILLQIVALLPTQRPATRP